MDRALEDRGRLGVVDDVGGGVRIGSDVGRRGGAAMAVAARVVPVVAPSMLTVPAMPPSLWPGMEQMNARPSAGIVTDPVAVCPASAAMTVPSAKVRSWMIEPVLTSLTSYVPAVGTVIAAGLKPRSKLSNSMVPVAAASAQPGGGRLVGSGGRSRRGGSGGRGAAGKVQPALPRSRRPLWRGRPARCDGDA